MFSDDELRGLGQRFENVVIIKTVLELNVSLTSGRAQLVSKAQGCCETRHFISTLSAEDANFIGEPP
jgi:hypothetical protein